MPRPQQPPDSAVTAPETSADAADPFPRERFVALVGRLPRYLRLAVGLVGDPRLPRTRRAAVLAAAVYLASPIDLIPGVIPIAGQLDDVAVALFALRTALRALDPAVRAEQLETAGLMPGDLDDDLAALGETALWLARRGVAVGRRLASLTVSASLAAGRLGVRVARRGAPVAARAGGRLARTGGLLARAAGSSVAGAGRRGAGMLKGRVRPGEGLEPDDS
ncbi:MAG: YkvA family protein [Chloroflexi bacterium]|nr:YkvA family protein [Chloroflexota bacterium]